MGYFHNHLATLVTGVFAAVLTGLWPWFNGFTSLLDFIFIMAIPITWFLTFTCWISQKSTDYIAHTPTLKPAQQLYTSEGKLLST